MALSLPVSLAFGVSVVSSLIPLPLLASRCLCCTYISSFPLTLPLIYPTTATLASWLFKYSKYTPISKPPETPSSPPRFIPSSLSSNVTSSERPALASKHYHSLSSYFIS